MRHPLFVLGLAVVLSGCGAAAQKGTTGADRAAAAPRQSGWIVAPLETQTTSHAAPTRTLAERGTILIGEPAPPPAPVRPRAHGRVVVSFHKADLENAMRFLADAGKFNLIVETGLTGQVTATLRGVDPFDALVMIAEANGAVVRYDRGIVMVKRASASTGPSASAR